MFSDYVPQERAHNGELPFGHCSLVTGGVLKLFKRPSDRELAKV